MSLRRRAVALAATTFAAACCAAAVRHAPLPSSPVGEAIYLRGELASGAALQGIRSEGLTLQGSQAACANCHRRSGLGSVEGSVSIPPITGQFLYHDRNAEPHPGDHVLEYVENAHGNREPYTDMTLARAIREGLDPQGRPLNILMPRFALSDADMGALIAYLKSLDRDQVPGVSDTVLQIATVLTPDTDPVKRRAVIDVLNQYFADKNQFPLRPSPRMRTSGATLYSKSMYVANRRWQLHVWELTGSADTWRQQLDRNLAREPVMAVISGLGGPNWRAVHDFCEQRRVPCLFPNVEVPVVERGDFYSVYLSRGVLLEADLMAAGLTTGAVTSVVQVYRAGDSGETGARELARALRAHGINTHERKLPAGKAAEGVSEALRGMTADAWVLWLRPADLAALGAPPKAPAVLLVSGMMGGLELAPLPGPWRERARLTYPVDLPDRRVVRVDYPLGWFRLRHIAVVDARLQADTYLACGILSETLNHMADAIVPEYLVEQLQQTLEHRILTGYYPRLTLAPGQTVGSKGAYWVRFQDAEGTRVAAEGGWTTP